MPSKLRSTVEELFEENAVYTIPYFYQRQYVWTREKQWESLWEDIRTKTLDLSQNQLLCAGTKRNYQHDRRNADDYAKLIAASPYTTEALKAIVELIGDEDLPDNGELSGAAVCDMARSAIDVAVNRHLTHA